MLRLLLLAASTVSIAAAQPQLGPAPAVHVSAVRIPEGGVQAQAKVGADGTVHLVFLRGDAMQSDVVYSRLRAGEGAFSTPVLVGEPGSAVAVGAIRGAQMVMGADRNIHVAWNGSGKRNPPTAGAHESGPMLYARSEDGGLTFTPPLDLMGSTWALDGGGSVAAGADGRVAVAWHAAYREGDEHDSARGLFVARSVDGGRTFAPEQRVAQAGTGCCACCALKAYFDPKDRVSVLYRAAAGNADRDMRLLAETSDGTFWATAVDPWRVDSCPVTTCTVALDGERVLLAWETRGQVWIGEVEGSTGAMVRRASVPGAEKSRKHPSIAVDSEGRVLLAWASADGWGAAGKVGWQVFDKDLRPIKDAAGSAEGLPAWSFPAAIAGQGGFTVLY